MQTHCCVRASERLLAAPACAVSQVGYCRSMNHIVALLLVALNRNQEHAFWLLAALVEGILYSGTYGRDLVGCQVRRGGGHVGMGQRQHAGGQVARTSSQSPLIIFSISSQHPFNLPSQSPVNHLSPSSQSPLTNPSGGDEGAG